MDDVFEHRMRQGLPPFDGVTLNSPDDIPLPNLLKVLRALVLHLRMLRPQARLFRLIDWHEHDGYITIAQPSSWDEIQAILTSEDTLYAASEDESYVRTAFFPEERDFYLRFYMPDNCDLGYAPGATNVIRSGYWDITCDEALAAELTEVLKREQTGIVNKKSAREYFGRR